jgi:hypothetical protein
MAKPEMPREMKGGVFIRECALCQVESFNALSRAALYGRNIRHHRMYRIYSTER